MVNHFEDMKPKDQSRINIYKLDDFNFWTEQLNVPSDTLVEAVLTVGDVRTDVEQFLKTINPEEEG